MNIQERRRGPVVPVPGEDAPTGRLTADRLSREHAEPGNERKGFRSPRRRVVTRDAVEYTILGLIYGYSGGAHGYQLKRQFDARYGDVWNLSFGQLYRVLGRLEQAGLIEGTAQVQTSRPTRKVYRLTASGHRAIDDWLPVTPRNKPSAPRDELSVRLLFLCDRPGQVHAIIQKQRAMDVQRLARLARRRSLLEQRGGATLVARLVLLQVDMRVRTDMAWLEAVEDALVEYSGDASRAAPLARPAGMPGEVDRREN